MFREERNMWYEKCWCKIFVCKNPFSQKLSLFSIYRDFTCFALNFIIIYK
jgi:hypothetical protein